MEDKEEIIVITARCIDMAAFCDDSDKMPCIDCGEMTWLSSSWRGKKIDKIICEHCLVKYSDEDSSASVTEECLNNAIKFLRERFYTIETDQEITERTMKIMEKKFGKKINIIK
jgi:hypothetical protein